MYWEYALTAGKRILLVVSVRCFSSDLACINSHWNPIPTLLACRHGYLVEVGVSQTGKVKYGVFGFLCRIFPPENILLCDSMLHGGH